MNKIKSAFGFTLIELMITVAIVAILAAIALPSYNDSILKSRRAEAKTSLMELSNSLERHFTIHNQYCGAATGDCAGSAVTITPSHASDHYTFTVDSSQLTFSVIATPTGAQADDICGTLSITQAGIQGSNDNSICW